MTALDSDTFSNHNNDIFSSVFRPPTKAFLSANTPSHHVSTVSKDSQSAWNLVTSWLRLPRSTVASVPPVHATRRLDDALFSLLTADDTAHLLLDWLSNEAQEYQEDSLIPQLRHAWQTPIPCSQAEETLSTTLDLLITSHNRVTRPLDEWLASSQDSELARHVTALRKALRDRIHANALHALPSKRLSKTISFVLHRAMCVWLLSSDSVPLTARAESVQSMLNSLRESGLGGASGQRSFAQAMNSLIEDYVQSTAVKVDWVGRESVTGRLRTWMHDVFVPVARDCLRCLTGQPDTTFFDSEIAEWENFALEKLAKQRIKYLFEYVRAWDHSTGAILDLKEYIQHTSEGKLLLANTFTQQLARRILHAGVTTSELLGMYINVICSFKALDPRGVLLDKVASPLRSYLRQRDDTVRIIAASFLADIDADGNVTKESDDVCNHLAREIALSEGEDLKVDEKGLDWDDMNWVPDPIDAGPDYKKSKSDDIMSFMLTLFERGDFIQEVQALLGERLLTVDAAQSDLDKEIRLVELFKTRFGPDGLQSCEVMLRDILESKRINSTLRPWEVPGFPTAKEIYAAIPEEGLSVQGMLDIFRTRVPRVEKAKLQFVKLIQDVAIQRPGNSLMMPKDESAITAQDPQFSTLILSSFFWPELREDEFSVPDPIKVMQKTYEADFEGIKNLRKLHWLSALGHVNVELELEDRTVNVDAVQTWQASVIYAFQEDDNNSSNNIPATKTVQELEEALSMDELLVRNAIAFWISHRVLVEVEPDTYQVLETLPSAEEGQAASAPAPAAAQAEATISAVKTQDAVLRDNKDMYELFMVGMLTNGGAMDPARVTMMMKMVVPGGYAFGEDETKWLLSDLVEQGKVVESGSSYAIKK